MIQAFNNTISVAGPEERPGDPPPLIFRPKWGPKGRKTFFGDRASPLISGSVWPPPPPPQWIRHCIYWRDTFLDSEDFRFWKHHPLLATVLLGTTLSGGGGGEGDSTKFYTGGSAPRSNPFPLIYCFWQKRYLFQIPSTDKWYHFHIPI